MLTLKLRRCALATCTKLATWESWTRMIYTAHCDQHRPPAEGLKAQRHRPEGVLDNGAIFQKLEPDL